MKVFVEGLEENSHSVSGDIDTSADDLNIGGQAGAFLPGIIGEIRIYNRALTPGEIQHNYLATKWRYR